MLKNDVAQMDTSFLPHSPVGNQECFRKTFLFSRIFPTLSMPKPNFSFAKGIQGFSNHQLLKDRSLMV